MPHDTRFSTFNAVSVCCFVIELILKLLGEVTFDWSAFRSASLRATHGLKLIFSGGSWPKSTFNL